MTTSKGAAPVWRSIGIVEVKPPSRVAVLARRLAPIVVPAVVMALFYLWGRTTMAIVVGALAVVIGGGSALFPPFRRGVERVTGFIGSGIGFIALSVVYVIIFLPIAIVLKLAGRTPLTLRADPSADTYWERIALRTPPRLYRRMFALEQPQAQRGPRRSWVRTFVVRLVQFYVIAAALVFTNYLVGYLLVDKPDESRTNTTRAEDMLAMKPYPWAKQWDVEYWGLRTQFPYHPMLMWVHPDIKGETLNIKDQLRRSYQPDLKGQQPIVVHFYGGSTTFGAYQRDEHTIPSEFARIAEAHGIPVQVANYGAIGYSTIQETTAFMLETLRGHIPQVAVFYNGWNDIVNGGLFPQRLDQPPFRAGPRVKSAFPIDDTFEKLDKYNALRILTEEEKPRPRFKPPTLDEAMQYLQTWYLGDNNINHKLGASYGIHVVTYLQPSYLTMAVPNHEISVDQLIKETSFWSRVRHDQTAEITRRLRAMLPPYMVDLSDALNGAPAAVYVDPIHTNEVGARMIAERMFRDLEPKLRELVQARGAN